MSKQLDWLAEEVLDTFTGLGFDAPYIEDKRHTLAGKDRFAVLVWCKVFNRAAGRFARVRCPVFAAIFNAQC
jgi:hypothetical protein